jgi:hypothetical protein
MQAHYRSQLGCTPPSLPFMQNRVYYKAHKFNIIIFWPGKTNKAEFFYFPHNAIECSGKILTQFTASRLVRPWHVRTSGARPRLAQLHARTVHIHSALCEQRKIKKKCQAKGVIPPLPFQMPHVHMLLLNSSFQYTIAVCCRRGGGFL